jgi:hypothetical protein
MVVCFSFSFVCYYLMWLVSLSNLLCHLKDGIANIYSTFLCFLAPEMVDKSVETILIKLRSLYSHAKELAENEIR